MNNNVNRFEALQALRAIAAGMVVYVHAMSTYAEKIGPISAATGKYGLGELGVKLFFCISGFIIYQSAKSLDAGWVSVSYFIRRRLIRIVPLYWLATLIYSAKLAFQGSAPEWSELLKSLLFWPYANDVGLMRPVLGVGWTLNYEMFFYFILGVALFLRGSWRLAAIFLPMLFLVLLHQSDFFQHQQISDRSPLFLISEIYLLFFISGVSVALLSSWRPRIRGELPFFWVVFACSVVLGVLVCVLSWFVLDTRMMIFLEILVCSACIFLCVESRNISSDTLISKISTWAGDGSFSTYLFHGFVMGVGARLISATQYQLSPLYFAILMVCICTTAGVLIYSLIERPTLKFLNGLWGGRKSDIRS